MLARQLLPGLLPRLPPKPLAGWLRVTNDFGNRGKERELGPGECTSPSMFPKPKVALSTDRNVQAISRIDGESGNGDLQIHGHHRFLSLPTPVGNGVVRTAAEGDEELGICGESAALDVRPFGRMEDAEELGLAEVNDADDDGARAY